MTSILSEPSSTESPQEFARWTPPHRPWTKQEAFLGLDCLEAFYGGAAGGGKSDALLMAALAYVHIPGYSAIILRKDTRRLELAGGLIPRSHGWLTGTDDQPTAAHWNGGARKWTFPSGATLSFGYLLHPYDKYRYGSSEYQFIAFDELTEFAEDDYLFLFSRLRKTSDVGVPLRMRSASNPGNIGHLWVRRRFLTDLQPSPPAGVFGALTSPHIWWSGDRAYVPARIGDNPALNEAQYRATLMHLPPLARERLMNGDWNVREEGLIRPEWLRMYQHEGRQLLLCDAAGNVATSCEYKLARRFVTIDPAGTSQDRVRERKGHVASWSVVQVWDVVTLGEASLLLLREQWRERLSFDGLCRLIRSAHDQWRPREMWIENEKLGQAAVDLLCNELPINTIATKGADKVARAAPLLHKLERGEVFLPRYAAWKADFEAELLAWTGDPEEPADQIDAAAYAARLALENTRLTRPVRILPVW